MRSAWVILAICLGVAGCNTTTDTASNSNSKPEPKKNVTGLSWKQKSGKNMGILVGYSELCSEFQGVAGSAATRNLVKNAFDGVEEYKSGYNQYASHRTADLVSGLHECKEVNEALEKARVSIEKLT